MSENENLLGLGSLWDSEQLNVELDLSRERERERKSEMYLRDALLELAADDGLTIRVAVIERMIHVRRIGMMWLDGVECGSSHRVIVPFGAISAAYSVTACTCALSKPSHCEFVPLGAVLRQLERRSAAVTIVGERFGIRGRVIGVWRDALTVRSLHGNAVVPRSSLAAVVVDNDGRRP